MVKKTVVTIIIAILLVGAVVGGYFAYETLSKTHEPSGGGITDKGETYKDFAMTDADGNAARLADFIGKPVVINFWASWCGPCKSELPHFDKLAKEYGDDVRFLMVNVFYDTKKQTLDFVSDSGYTFPLYFDDRESAVKAYGITAVPQTIFITEDGTILAKRSGAMSEAVLKNYITQLLRGQTVPEDTKPDDTTPTDTKPEDTKPEDTKPEDTKPEDASPPATVGNYKDFAMTDADGNAVRLADFIGKPVVINFWASWCGPCKSELPHFDKLAKEYRGQAEFLMVSVYLQKDVVKEFVSDSGYTFSLYFDDNSEGSAAYEVTGIPVTVFITADGNVSGQTIGAMSEAALRSRVAQILN